MRPKTTTRNLVQLDLVNGKVPQGDWVEQIADRQTGSLDREAYVLDFDLSASEFQGAEWVQEEDEYSPLTAGASSSGLIPPFEPSEYVQSALLPHAHTGKFTRTCTHSRR